MDCVSDCAPGVRGLNELLHTGKVGGLVRLSRRGPVMRQAVPHFLCCWWWVKGASFHWWWGDLVNYKAHKVRNRGQLLLLSGDEYEPSPYVVGMALPFISFYDVSHHDVITSKSQMQRYIDAIRCKAEEIHDVA